MTGRREVPRAPKAKRGLALIEVLRGGSIGGQGSQPIGALPVVIPFRTDAAIDDRNASVDRSLDEFPSKAGAQADVQVDARIPIGYSLFLTRSQAAGFGAVLMILGLGIFLAGDRLGPTGYRRGFQAGSLATQGGIDEGAATLAQPVNVTLLEGLTARNNAPASKIPAVTDRSVQGDGTGRWTVGASYVVAQEYEANVLEDARKGQAFLAEAGVPTVIVPTRAGGLLLVSTSGYNGKDPVQKKAADDLVERVHSLGAKFFSEGGRYRLKGYLKTYRGSW